MSPVYFAENSHVHRTNECAKMAARKTTGWHAFTFVAPKLWDDFTAASSGGIEIFFKALVGTVFICIIAEIDFFFLIYHCILKIKCM